MNTCESYAALLDAFAEGDLFTEDMVRVQQHLLNCPDCQSYLDDLLAIQAAFPKIEDTVVPPDFSAKVMTAVAATPQERPVSVPQKKAAAKPSTKRKTPWGRVLVPLAACCAIVILLQGRLSMGGASQAPAAGENAFMLDTAPMEAKAEESAVEMEAPAAPMPETEAYAEPVEIPAQAKQTTPTSNDTYEYAAQESDTVEYSPYRIRIDVDAAYIGDALDGYTPVIEADSPGTGRTELHYELTMAQYEDLLHALADRNELPAEEEFETDSDLVLVIVH
ncbi:MAG: zf-HC2 domain-containing protein [Oscillibacter sp.]|nr:zf-HC2 domain-containing protein [Oscillibacter sp.]